MSMSTRKLSAAIARFEHEARFEHRMSREQIAYELRRLREDGREFAREELLRNYP
jgi:hypothetical protein